MKQYSKWIFYTYSPVIKYMLIGLGILFAIEAALVFFGSFSDVMHIIALLYASLSNLLITGLYIVAPILFMVNQAFGKGLERALVVPVSRYKVLLSQIISGVVMQLALTVVMIISLIPTLLLTPTAHPALAEQLLLSNAVPLLLMSLLGMINGITTWQLLFYGAQTKLARRMPKWLRVLVIIVAYFVIVFTFEMTLQQFGFSSLEIGFQAGVSMVGIEDTVGSFDLNQLTLLIYLLAVGLLSVAEYGLARFFLKHKVEI